MQLEVAFKQCPDIWRGFHYPFTNQIWIWNSKFHWHPLGFFGIFNWILIFERPFRDPLLNSDIGGLFRDLSGLFWDPAWNLNGILGDSSGFLTESRKVRILRSFRHPWGFLTEPRNFRRFFGIFQDSWPSSHKNFKDPPRLFEILLQPSTIVDSPPKLKRSLQLDSNRIESNRIESNPIQSTSKGHKIADLFTSDRILRIAGGEWIL